MNGWWWTSCADEGWEGFAPTMFEAFAQIREANYASYGGDPIEFELRPGLNSDDETKPIVFTGPSETFTF